MNSLVELMAREGPASPSRAAARADRQIVVVCGKGNKRRRRG